MSEKKSSTIKQTVRPEGSTTWGRKYRGTGIPVSEAQSKRWRVEREGLKIKTAPCVGMDSNLWFRRPGHTHPKHLTLREAEILRNQEALQLCYTCPHRVECLQYAMDADEPYGIFGGVLCEERKNVQGHDANWLIAQHDKAAAELGC
jgi:hypothetical protein